MGGKRAKKLGRERAMLLGLAATVGAVVLAVLMARWLVTSGEPTSPVAAGDPESSQTDRGPVFARGAGTDRASGSPGGAKESSAPVPGTTSPTSGEVAAEPEPLTVGPSVSLPAELTSPSAPDELASTVTDPTPTETASSSGTATASPTATAPGNDYGNGNGHGPGGNGGGNNDD
ncbi:MAG: hypothetical protein ACRDOM_01325 [Nocardioides sp.]